MTEVARGGRHAGHGACLQTAEPARLSVPVPSVPEGRRWQPRAPEFRAGAGVDDFVNIPNIGPSVALDVAQRRET